MTSAVPAGQSVGPVTTARRFVVELALLVALVAGLLEALIQLLVIRHGFHRPIFGDERLLWVIPVGYLAAMLPFLGVALLIVGRRCTPRRLLVATVVILWPALFGLLALEANLYAAALAVVAGGLAVTGARLLARGGLRLEPAVRRLALSALTIAVAAGVTVELRTGLRERGRIAALPQARAGAPNVLLLVWDTVRGIDLSLYGYPRPTSPNLERLALEGTTYSNAFSTAPWTLPSHSSMFSGLLEQELVVGHMTPFRTSRPVLSEEFARHGYLTGGFVGNVTYAGNEYGLSRGFLHFEDYRRTLGTVLFSPGAVRRLGLEWRFRSLVGIPAPFNKKTATHVNREFLRWVDRADGRPFFAFLNYFDAHNPYTAPPPYDTTFGADPQRRIPSRDVRADAVDRLIAGYDATIAYLDHEAGALLDSLRRRNLLENTVVIITADHGEHFGEHGLYNHSNSLYRELLLVPLVIRFPPRLAGGAKVEAPVSLRDLAATIVDLAGLPDPSRFPGTSLVRRGAADPGATSEYRLIAGETTLDGVEANAVIVGDRYFISWPSRPPALYRFPDDSVQEENLAARPEFQREMASFMALSDSLDDVRRQTRKRR